MCGKQQSSGSLRKELTCQNIQFLKNLGLKL